MKKMKVWITGASGFLGSSLKKELERGENIQLYCPSSKELNLLEELDVIAMEAYDYVIHCATLHGFSPDEHTLYKNLFMYYNLKFYCDFYGSRLINIGSGASYDSLNRDLMKVKEKEILSVLPKDEYGLSKNIISKDIESGNNINLIPFSIFGIGELIEKRFISRSILRTIYGLPIVIKKDRDMNWIPSSCFALWIKDIIEKKEVDMFDEVLGSYNLVGSISFSLKEIAKLILKISTSHSHYIVVDDSTRAYSYTGSNEKIYNLIEKDYFQFDFEKDIENIYKYYYDNKEKYDIRKVL